MLRQDTIERCEAAVRQYEAQISLLQNSEFCTGCSRTVQAEQTRQRLEPVVAAYREYRRLASDVAAGAEMLRGCSEQERPAAQDFYA